MIKKIFLLISLISLFSCSNKKVEYDDNGNKIKEYELVNNNISGEYKEFYKNGNLKIIANYRDGVETDSTIFYNPKKEIVIIDRCLPNKFYYRKEFNNNVLISEGKFFNKNAIGKWKFYNKNRKIDKVIEYVNLCRDSYANQIWYFDEKGDTLKKLGNYFDIKPYPKKIKTNEVITIQMIYKPILYLNSSLEGHYCVDNKVYNDFCDLRKFNKYHFSTSQNMLTARLTFRSIGKRYIRGYIKEYFDKDATKTDSITHEECFVYFNIPIIVN